MGDTVGSILFVKNNYEIDSELLKRLEKDYKTYVAIDTWAGLDIISEQHIDTFIFMSDNHIEKSTQNFLKELYTERSQLTPIIFVSEKPDKALQSKINKSNSWYFTPYPIHHEDFIEIVKNSMVMATLLDDKSIILKKSGHEYHYNIRDISRIQRSKDKHIKVYSRNAETGIKNTEEFFYNYPLHKFSKHHNIEKQIKQAHQSWLVNASKVKEIRVADTELVLTDGTVVPTSRKYINNFRKRKPCEE